MKRRFLHLVRHIQPTFLGREMLAFLLLILAGGLLSAQVTVINQESFESDGNGTRYTTSPAEFTTGANACNDFFTRKQDESDGANNATCPSALYNDPAAEDGTFFFASEDDENGTPILTMNAVTVTGYSSLNVKILFAIGRDLRYEVTDSMTVEYNMDAGGWNTIGAFYGQSPGPNAALQQDTNLDGVGDGGFLTTTFQDFTFSVPVTGNSLQVRVTMGQNGGGEELFFDNIRIEGVASANVAPVLANIEGTPFSYTENDPQTAITSALTITDSDDTDMEGATVSIVGGHRQCEDSLYFTTQNGITGSFNATSGVLTLTGTATIANYQTALRSITYMNTNPVHPDTVPRTIRFIVDDGTAASNAQDRIVNISRALDAAGTLPYVEDFETDGLGTRYDANRFSDATEDFFDRLSDGSGFLQAGDPTNESNTYYFAGRDFDDVTGVGGNNCENGNIRTDLDGVVRLKDLNASGLVNFDVIVRLGAPASIFEPEDYIKIEAAFDGNIATETYTTVGAFYGLGANSSLTKDADLNGTADSGGDALSTAMTDHTFSIPGTGNLLSVRVVFGTSTTISNDEEMYMDFIRVNGQTPCVPGTVSVQPTNGSDCIGSPVTFTIDTTGTVDSVRWHLSTNGGTTWTPLANGAPYAGTTTLDLTVTPGGAGMSGNQYLAVVYACNPASTDSSTAASLTICNPSFTFCPATQNANSGAGCNAVVTYSNPTATSDCGAIDSLVLISGNGSGGTFPVGTTEEVYVAYKNGCTDTCRFDVVVVDAVAPNAVCQSATIQLDNAGAASLTAAQVDGGSNDACGVTSTSVSPNSFTCSDVGTSTVVLTVSDAEGNTSTCNATVTIQDNVAPLANCKNLTVNLDGSGNGSTTANDLNNVSTDACGIGSLSASKTTFTCADLGTNNVTLTVTDVNSNVSTCTSVVTVLDPVNPSPICQNITKYLNGSGAASVAGVELDGGSTDNCSVSSFSANPTTFNCGDIGATSVVMTVTDGSGNTSNCTSVVTVLDTIAPAAVCQDFTLQLNSSGQATLNVNNTDGGSSDNCAVSNRSLSKTTFICGELGTNSVNMVVSDGSGNNSTCSSTITVEDNLAPNAICQDVTVNLDTAGNGSVTANDIDNNSSDNCTVSNLALNNTTFDCADLGSNTVTLTVTDQSTNQGTCNANVTVRDLINPNAVCQAFTVYLDPSGNASITGTDIDGGSTDNCSIVTRVATPNLFTCSSVGTNTVTLAIEDQSGNISNCNATVTVVDTVAAAPVCQNFTLDLDASGNGSITVNQVDGGSSDACGISTRVLSGTTFNCSDVGVNPITLTLTDVNSNVSSCIASITVRDTVPPIPVCQPLTRYLDAGGAASIFATDIDNGSNDACGVAFLSASQTNFVCADTGANTVTLTVLDVNGNQSTCNGVVTVFDTTAPAAVCQDITVSINAQSQAPLSGSDLDGGSSDNCSVVSRVSSVSAFFCNDIGSHPVTMTVEDPSGNVSTCVSNVTVQDVTPPTANCKNFTLNLSSGGSGSISVSDINNGSTDNCGLAGLTISQNSFNCNQIGSNPVTLTATDGGGNVSTCTATVTVSDNTPPTAVCQSVTVALPVTGFVSVLVNDIENGSSDICGIATFSLSQSTFGCSDLGTNTISLSVTDNNGNVGSCNATVTVLDTFPPIAVCQDITVSLNGAGNATIGPADIDGGSSDACGNLTLATSQAAFSCADVGLNTVTLTATDQVGTSVTCTANVTVQDTLPPAAICQDITVTLDSNGTFPITGNDLNNGSSDFCGIDTIFSSIPMVTCNDVGTNAFTLSVVDVSGNVTTCSSNITVIDNVAPDAKCKDITVSLDAAGNASINSADVDDGSFDNCALDTIFVAPSNFLCTQIGSNAYTLTMSDQYGNVSGCSGFVTVEDNLPPTALCLDLTIQLSDQGATSISASDVDGGSSDNCGVDNIFLDDSTFTCIDTGMNTVLLTVVDDQGNSSTCNANITVLDDLIPVPAINISVTGNGDTIFNVSTSAAYTYQWYEWSPGGNIIIPGATGTTYQPTAAGCYLVSLTTLNNCVTFSDTTCNIPVGIVDGLEAFGLEVFPNPTLGQFFLETSVPISEPVQVRITDMYGKVLHQRSLEGLKGRSEFDLTPFAKGIYLLQVQTSSGKSALFRVVNE